MPELNGAAKDTETDGAVLKRLTVSQMAALSVAGLVGGIVGAVFLGMAVPGILGALTGWKASEGFGEAVGWFFFIGGAFLGLPLGIAAGLRVAGTMLGIRGRFWPALGASYASILAWLGLLVLLQYLVNRTHIPTAVVHYQPFLLFAGPSSFRSSAD